MRRIGLSVGGMTCSGCVGTAQRALARVPGVRSASVKLDAARADVEADDMVDPAMLQQALEKAGYTASILA